VFILIFLVILLFFCCCFFAINLSTVTKRIVNGNAYKASKALCHMMRNGIAGVVHGPLSPISAMHVQSICDTKEMPLLETRYDPLTKQPIINLHPHPEVLSKMLLDLVEAWEWEHFTIIYETASW
jgi:glutamate receptor, ionotropic, invertebrate